jgi:serine/threonine-protein kinase
VADSESADLVRAKQRVGQVLRDKYRIDRVLGVGGMAAVYAVTHRNQKQFAVKVLHTELSYREDIRSRFLREGYAANSVRHPGAVAVLDDDVAEDGSAFLVMELLEGASVEALSEQAGGRIAESYVTGIAHQLLDTIASAHAQGIVHRDIKPANLFLTREGQLKVLDFGIARVRDVASGTTSGATGTGVLLGTPAFMAPEQAIGKSNEIDAQTDLWAVGATLFTLLSGHLVHAGETPSHLVILAATTPARPLASLAPHVPPPLAAIVDRALAFQKSDRWPNALAMRDAVRDASLSLFGRLPVRETLMPIFGNLSPALGETQPAHSYVATPVPGAAPAYAAPAHTPAHVGVATTATPVATDEPAPSLPAGVPRRRPGTLIAVATLGVLVLAGGAAAVVRSVAGVAETAESSAAGSPALPATAPSSSAESASAPAPSASEAAPSKPTAAAKAGAIGPVAPAPGIPAPSASVKRPAAMAPASPLVSPSQPSPATPSPSPASTATPTCRLVSFFDAEGNKHFKQECH